MERDDVITFFHEFGHLIHGIMRGNTKWAEGDLENDFIEAPSQMFEEWPQGPRYSETLRAPLQNQRAHSRRNWRRKPGPPMTSAAP